jgi:uncharacterized protein YbcI
MGLVQRTIGEAATMGKVDKTLENAVKELEQFFTERLTSPIEVKYDAIHLQLVGNLSSEDVEAVYRILKEHAQTVHRWRVQQVNNMLLLSLVTAGAV